MAKEGNAPPRRALARGLSALLGDVDDRSWNTASENALTMAPIEFLKPSRFQPRRRFDKESLDSLADSIRSKGVIQPLVVRPDSQNPGSFEIITGERRWRAAQVANIHEVPIVVRDISDREALEIGLIENIQRADLTPIEEAAGYQRLIDEFDHSQSEMAKVIGKSRSHVANMIRLLGLPDAVKEMVDGGQLSAGHARALLSADRDKQIKLAEQVVARGLSVRQTESLMKRESRPRRSKAVMVKDADTRAIENQLSDLLDLAVDINHRGPGGTVSIRYGSLTQLDHLLQRFGVKD